MDNGHADSYRLFHLIHKKNAFFVTQAKDNMRFDTRLFPRKSQPISLCRVYSDLKTSKGQQCFRSKKYSPGYTQLLINAISSKSFRQKTTVYLSNKSTLLEFNKRN